MRAGYDQKKFTVIPNGFDLDYLKPDKGLRSTIRSELHIPADAKVMGMVGRWHPQKDHATLLRSLADPRVSGRQVWVLLVGPDMVRENTALISLISGHPLADRILLLGPRLDLSAIDLHILSSAFGEAFPNVLAEAMACGAPCITTDVGDAKGIIGDTGWLVPIRDPVALATAMVKALEAMVDMASWQHRQVRCRERILSKFSIERMAGAYEALWVDLVSCGRMGKST